MATTNKRVALVTGGTRGIGRAIARRLFEDGFSVVISGHTEASTARAVEELAREKILVAGRAANARLEEDQRALVELAFGQAGRLNVLVNNAGIGEFAPVDRLEPERFREILETNLFGPYYAIHAAAPRMREGGGGFIVNIASLARSPAAPPTTPRSSACSGCPTPRCSTSATTESASPRSCRAPSPRSSAARTAARRAAGC